MDETLRQRAERRGLLIGAACAARWIAAEEDYARILAREFNVIVAENGMKFRYTQPEPGAFRFEEGDALADFAGRHGQRLRGHTLVWHNALPEWVQDADWTAGRALEELRRHIAAVAGHFRGRVICWDVVNEALDDDGGWREKSPWHRMIGPDYLAEAFRAARAADPGARLIYNDYGMELPGPKADGCHRMIRGLLEAGVPVDGVGFQFHLGLENRPDAAACAANLRRFADLGLEVQVTEMDMGIRKPVTDALRREQAVEYARRLGMVLAVPAVTQVLFWGFTDRHTWVPGFTKGEYDEPLLFDRDGRPKPAHGAVLEALAGGASR